MIYFSNDYEFDMNLYTLSTEDKYILEKDEGIIFMASNPFTNGTPTVFEIQY